MIHTASGWLWRGQSCAVDSFLGYWVLARAKDQMDGWIDGWMFNIVHNISALTTPSHRAMFPISHNSSPHSSSAPHWRPTLAIISEWDHDYMSHIRTHPIALLLKWRQLSLHNVFQSDYQREEEDKRANKGVFTWLPLVNTNTVTVVSSISKIKYLFSHRYNPLQRIMGR